MYDNEEEDEEEDKPNIDHFQNTINKIEPIQNAMNKFKECIDKLSKR